MIIENRGVIRWEEKAGCTRRPVVLHILWIIEGVCALLLCLLFLMVNSQVCDKDPESPLAIILMWVLLLALDMAVTAVLYRLIGGLICRDRFSLQEVTGKGVIATVQKRPEGSIAPEKKKSTIIDFENVKKAVFYKKASVIELKGLGSKGDAVEEIGAFLGANVTRGAVSEMPEPLEFAPDGEAPHMRPPEDEPADIRYAKACAGRQLRNVCCRLYIGEMDYEQVVGLISERLPQGTAVKEKR